MWIKYSAIGVDFDKCDLCLATVKYCDRILVKVENGKTILCN